jgi:hypothetical protein
VAPPAAPVKNWTEAQLVEVREAARQFYLPPWIAESIWIFENGVPGYEGGQSAQAKFTRRWIEDPYGRQLWTTCQTLHRILKSYMAKPYVRQAWASTDQDLDAFLWRHRTDFLKHAAAEWAPRVKDEEPDTTEARWVAGVRAIALKRRRKN